MFQYIERIKDHYEHITPRILSIPDSRWVDPYTNSINWGEVFSPIEEQTWMALRCFGHAPFYPQYPAEKYFLDFGNPKLKMAIECDGKEWHQDKEKDGNRDIYLHKNGWKTFRITGAECFRICEGYENRYELDEDDCYAVLREYYTTIEGLIKALGMFYFGYKDYSYFDMEGEIALECLLKHISPKQLEFFRQSFHNRFNELMCEYYDYKESIKSKQYGS